MKVAVIGSGIAGLAAADRVRRIHDVTVFEAEDRPGGHSHTVTVETPSGLLGVDTGFIVFNRRNYPGFSRLLDRLGVASRPTQMSFSVSCARTGLEYNGTDLNGLFAQRRNLASPSFHRLLVSILRFNRRARRDLHSLSENLTLGDYLQDLGTGNALRDLYLVPMGAAIWSTSPDRMLDFPAAAFLRFLNNHGLLDLSNRPQWRTVVGGSFRYVEALARPLGQNLRLSTPVRSVTRHAEGIEIRCDGQQPEIYDRVVMACHTDQSLSLLQAPHPLEREILQAIRYQTNDTILHTDAGLMPRQRRAWASWNAYLPETPGEGIPVTYCMNLLQGFETDSTLLVSLNRTATIFPDTIVRRFRYRHPLFTVAAMAAQRRRREISGRDRIHYCGAAWGYGFHEDGYQSGIAVAEELGIPGEGP